MILYAALLWKALDSLYLFQVGREVHEECIKQK